MKMSMAMALLDNPPEVELQITLKNGDGFHILERGVDYEINPDNSSITIKSFNLSSGVISITSVSGTTTVGVGKSRRTLSSKKSKQPNYRDILPKRERRW